MLKRFRKSSHELHGSSSNTEEMLRQADAARDARQFKKAADLYRAVLKASPKNPSIHMQCGHMYKEAGDFTKAERHYEHARSLMPQDADIALQFGHLYKIAARLKEAEEFYLRAIELDPDWAEPAIQLAEFYRSGWRNRRVEKPAMSFFRSEVKSSSLIRLKGELVPELAPRKTEESLYPHQETIELLRLGRSERTHWGQMQVLRGVQAVRGFCISATKVDELRLAMNGLVFYKASLDEFPLAYERDNPSLKKYVFNVWFDFSYFANGLHDFALQFMRSDKGIIVRNENILIGEPSDLVDFPDSDSLVAVTGSDPRSLEEQINMQPSVVRSARRNPLNGPPRSILVMRTDQLGDLVISVPALRRLKTAFPKARVVGLLTAGNVDLAKTLDLFDDIVVAEFPSSQWERRRVMAIEDQIELRKTLHSYNFDVAIDLCEDPMSRPLMLLTGAKFTCGFKSSSCRLSATFEANTYDPINLSEMVPYSSKLVALIDWLITMMKPQAETIRNPKLDRRVLISFGITDADRYAALHMGARLEHSKWPHFGELAKLILERTDLKVVLIADNANQLEMASKSLDHSDRLFLIDGKLSFEQFDGLLSFCSVFVGNDSGPKHLASLRGANVVSLHMARNNWCEWGQDNTGYIISRRVPCAGCLVHYSPEDCGKDFACIKNITAEEVFGAVKRLLDSGEPTPQRQSVQTDVRTTA